MCKFLGNSVIYYCYIKFIFEWYLFTFDLFSKFMKKKCTSRYCFELDFRKCDWFIRLLCFIWKLCKSFCGFMLPLDKVLLQTLRNRRDCINIQFNNIQFVFKKNKQVRRKNIIDLQLCLPIQDPFYMVAQL